MNNSPVLDKLARRLALSAGIAVVCAPAAQGAFVVVDMDTTTPAPAFEAAVTVTLGTPFTVTVYVVHDAAPTAFNTIGMNLNWGIGGDTGTLAPAAPPFTFAGALAGMTGTGLSLIIAGPPVAPGGPMGTFGFPPAAGFTASIGGVGYYDTAAPAAAPAGHFGPFGVVPNPPGTFASAFTVALVGTGLGTVSVGPTGLIAPGAYPPGSVPPPLPPPAPPGGDPFYDSATGLTMFATGLIPGTVTIVPEPEHVAVVTGFACLAAGWLLRRRNH